MTASTPTSPSPHPNLFFIFLSRLQNIYRSTTWNSHYQARREEQDARRKRKEKMGRKRRKSVHWLLTFQWLSFLKKPEACTCFVSLFCFNCLQLNLWQSNNNGYSVELAISIKVWTEQNATYIAIGNGFLLQKLHPKRGQRLYTQYKANQKRKSLIT